MRDAGLMDTVRGITMSALMVLVVPPIVTLSKSAKRTRRNFVQSRCFAPSGTKLSGEAREGYSRSLYTLSMGKELFSQNISNAVCR